MMQVTHEERECKVEFQWKRVRLFVEVAVRALCEQCQVLCMIAILIADLICVVEISK